MTILGIIMGGCIGAATGLAFRQRNTPIFTLTIIAAVCMALREIWP
jgi:hypothetical protein